MTKGCTCVLLVDEGGSFYDRHELPRSEKADEKSPSESEAVDIVRRARSDENGLTTDNETHNLKQNNKKTDVLPTHLSTYRQPMVRPLAASSIAPWHLFAIGVV